MSSILAKPLVSVAFALDLLSTFSSLSATKNVTAGTAVRIVASADAKGGVRRTFHCHDLLCTDSSDQDVISSSKISVKLQHLP